LYRAVFFVLGEALRADQKGKGGSGSEMDRDRGVTQGKGEKSIAVKKSQQKGTGHKSSIRGQRMSSGGTDHMRGIKGDLAGKKAEKSSIGQYHTNHGKKKGGVKELGNANLKK